MWRYYQSKPKFIGVYSRNNLPKAMKDGAYMVNFVERKSIGTHWIASYFDGSCVRYSDRFGVKHISQEIKRFLRSKNIITKYMTMSR